MIVVVEACWCEVKCFEDGVMNMVMVWSKKKEKIFWW